MNLYRNESSDPKRDAQRNLCGRTHYVDDDTLRFHKSKVLSRQITDGGLLFAIITSDALNPDNTKRGFRYVIFDIFGNVIGRVQIADAFKTSEKASKAMWVALNAIDAKAVTLAAIDQQETQHAAEMTQMRSIVAELAAKQLVAS